MTFHARQHSKLELRFARSAKVLSGSELALASMGKRHFSLIAVGDRLRLVRFGQAVTPRTLRVVAR
jgi:hypothetical protein